MSSTKMERLREYHDQLVEQAEEIALEQQVTALRTLIEGTINADDPILSGQDIARETGWPGVPSAVSMPHDRVRGAYWPFFRTDMELSQIRAIGRILATTTETGVSILESLINYTVSEGIHLQWQARDKSIKGDVRIERAQQVVDLFLERNKIIQSGQRALMHEAIPAGEALLILRPNDADGVPRVSVRSVDHLVEPIDVQRVLDYHGYSEGLEDGLDWSFGIATPPFQYDDVRGYFCQWYGALDNWEYLPASCVVHVKLNVPADVKRGLSDYYAAYDNIRRSKRGFNAAAEGATLQSSIAYIEKFKQGTPRQAVEDQLPSPATYSTIRPGRQGLIPVRVEQLGMGRILRTDRDIMYGPLGAPQGAKLIEVFQSVLRMVGTRWNMPEWMISGDASNNNMASSITAGSAFDVSSQARQQAWGEYWVEATLKAMRMMGVDVDELQKIARLTAKGSQIAARDEVQDEQIRDIRAKAGILSKRTWSQEAGLDYDEEQANIEAEPKQEPPPMFGGGPGGGPGEGPPQPPGGEDGTGGEKPPGMSQMARTEGLAFTIAEQAIKASRLKRIRETEDDESKQGKTEAFCPTGEGGGQDNSCPPGNKGTGEVDFPTARGKIDKDESARLLDSVKQNDGFTYQPVDDSTPTKGFVVSRQDGPIIKLDELTVDDIYNFLKSHSETFDADPEAYAGGWVSEGEVHLDLVTVKPDEESATALGIKNNQYAIWDLAGKREIEVESERTKARRAAHAAASTG